ncbi:trypsin-like serine protease [Streptomyces sp. NPDC087850]|uniref:trypsin-like serine protease n=1 Tax=Streptomyces sp. NPDC087850 TaxID=3365809 RepID=UPI00380431D3
MQRALTSKTRIATAERCVADSSGKVHKGEFQVLLGAFSDYKQSATTKDARVLNRKTDVAMLVLPAGMKGAGIPTVSRTEPERGQNATLYGSGRTPQDTEGKLIHSLDVGVSRAGEGSSEVQTGGKRHCACDGDSGGPLVRKVGGKYQLLAVIHASNLKQGECPEKSAEERRTVVGATAAYYEQLTAG